MKESIKTRVKIKAPWVPEFNKFGSNNGDGLFLRFNMFNTETGEIRQKTVTLDYIARHLFKNIETEKR